MYIHTCVHTAVVDPRGLARARTTSDWAPRISGIPRAAFSKLYFWVDMHRGWVLPRKFEKFDNWAKPSPRSNPVIMHRTITGILRKIREIEALSMGVETLRGYNLDRPPCCNPKTRNHKQASIFIELADAFRSETHAVTDVLRGAVLLYYWERVNYF